MKTIIKNGKIVDPESSKITMGDVYISDDKIADAFVEDDLTQVIDATGLYIVPGLIDIHVHFRDPGYTDKENILTGSMAAAAGGFTTICCMPNTKPPIDSINTLKYIDNRGKIADYVNLLSTCAMTLGQNGHQLVDFSAMNDFTTLSKDMNGHGVCGITEDGKTLYDDKLMHEVCIKAKELDLIVMDHPEPETKITARDIEFSKKTGCNMHLQHISKAESVQLIREAKKNNINVTAEVAPHHFALNKDSINTYGTNAKMNPPLSEEKDRIAVIEGIKDGTIDVIATDHAPHTEEDKSVGYTDSPNGIIGLETSFPICYTNLVKEGIIDLNKLIYMMSTRPAELLGVRRGTLEVGKIADVSIVDIDTQYKIDKSTFQSKARNTPFHGMKVQGKAVVTIRSGKISWENTI